MSGPKIPSRDELNGRAIDNATEAAARFRYLADQLGSDTDEGKAALRAAEGAKAEVRKLRRRPLF